MQMQNMLVAALSMKILPTTLVPAVAAMPTVFGTFSEAQDVSSIVVSATRLSRFGGNQVAGATAQKVLETLPHETTVSQFPPLEVVLIIPLWSKLLTISVLLGIFAAAIVEDEDSKDKKVRLVRPSVIAVRLAGTVGCFAVHAASKSEAATASPVWALLFYVALCLCSFVVTASDSGIESEKNTEQVVNLVSMPAIAARLAFAAGLFGAPEAIRAVAPYLQRFVQAFVEANPNGATSFPSSESSLDVPAWAQLLMVAVLVGIFAAAVLDDELKDNAEEKRKSKTVYLVCVPAIATRIAVAAGCFALHAALRLELTEFSFVDLTLPSINLQSSHTFATSEVHMDIPEWGQLLVMSMLLGIFAAVTSDDNKDSQKVVQLISVPSIAARFAVAAALFGAPGAAHAVSSVFGPSANFPVSELKTEVIVWVQFAVVALLLGIFAAAVSEDEAEGVNLIRLSSISARLATAAGCFALHAAVVPSVPSISFAGLTSAFHAIKMAYTWIPIQPSPVFASVDTTLDTPIFAHLLVISCLLFVLTVLLRDDIADKNVKKASPKQAQLVRPDAIAARFGMAAAVFAVFEVIPRLACSDVLAKGGLLVAGTALVLSEEIQKNMSSKKVE